MSHAPAALWMGVLLGSMAACDARSGGAPAGSASAPAVAPASAAASASSAPQATATASSAPAGATRSWRGTYKSVAAALAVPSDKNKVHWSDSQTSAGVGEGALTLTVDGASGHVSGSLEGALGPATVEGAVADGKLTASLRRKDPTDQGFTGTVLGTVSGDHLEGTMNLSLGLATTLRTATFTLAPAP
jgi:hypothetical protein